MAAEGGHEDILEYLASGLRVDMNIQDENGVSMKDCNGRENSMFEFELALFPGIWEKFLYSLSIASFPVCPEARGEPGNEATLSMYEQLMNHIPLKTRQM